MGTRGPKNQRLMYFIRHVMEPSTGCRIWPYSKGTGHGQMRIDGTLVIVSRLTCEIWHGPPPDDRAQAAHSCGTRGCWAGEHLRWLSPVENEADKRLHGTAQQGERHHAARLTEADVLEIRQLFAAGGITKTALAAKYGITVQNAYNIIKRKTWMHI